MRVCWGLGEGETTPQITLHQGTCPIMGPTEGAKINPVAFSPASPWPQPDLPSAAGVLQSGLWIRHSPLTAKLPAVGG